MGRPNDRLVAFALLFVAGGLWLTFGTGASGAGRLWGIVIAFPAATYLWFCIRAQIRATKEDNRQARIRREQRRRSRG
jgi:outer membrane protein TolC